MCWLEKDCKDYLSFSVILLLLGLFLCKIMLIINNFMNKNINTKCQKIQPKNILNFLLFLKIISYFWLWFLLKCTLWTFHLLKYKQTFQVKRYNSNLSYTCCSDIPINIRKYMWEKPRFWENKEGEKAEFIYSLYLYFSYDIPI